MTIDLTRGPVSQFLPNDAFGAAVDGQEQGDIGRIYTPDNIAKMLSAGLRSVSYSLRSELEDEAFHWSEQGTWSDPEHRQGYWISSDTLSQNDLVSYGYHLPRRGNTFDQAENHGYSRITDGDESTFWKSNPYLDQRFTGDDNALHPQWVVIDLGHAEPVNALKVDWGTPYATRYAVQFWTGSEALFDETRGEWHTFLNGSVGHDDGTSRVIRLVGTPVEVRFVRILLLHGSATAPAGSTDIRDSLGFAIRELSLGVVDANGVFQDEVHHGPSNSAQTAIYTSSTDPWHTAMDRDNDTEQPGFDLLFQSGLARDLPALISVPILYDTPENVAAEIRFLKGRRYPISRIALGEEPDGQVVSTEHAAALYLEFAKAIHEVDPALILGGPSFQGGFVYQGFDVKPDTSWVQRFLAYLGEHRGLDDYRFLSFEWYPFIDLCQDPSAQLREAPDLLRHSIDSFHAQGIPASMPMLVTEYGFAAFAGRDLVELPGALINADIVGQFLTLGGQGTYFYGYEPQTPFNEQGPCAGDGQLMLLESDAQGRALWPMPTYFAARLMSEQWAQPLNRRHKVFPASTTIRDSDGHEIVTAYAVLRPDGQLSLMLVNKHPSQAYSLRLKLQAKTNERFTGELTAFQYSTKQYSWHEDANSDNERPFRDDPPRQFYLRDQNAPIVVPPYSLTILRGTIPSGAVQIAGREAQRLHIQ